MIISTPQISLEVAESGAELISLKKGKQEYLWQADKNYWGRRAPILFPIVGRLWNDEYRLDNKLFDMKQHGFARDAKFEYVDENTFLLKSSIETFEKYPYHFELRVHYLLNGNKVIATWTVNNTGDKCMYFQIGAHPGFYYPDFCPTDFIHGYLAFEKNGRMLNNLQISSLEEGFVAQGKYCIALTDFLLPLQNDLFKHDALVIEDQQIEKITMFDKMKKPYLSVTCPQSEVLGIWSPNKPGCPFVCIEPWCGRADNIGFNGELNQRAYIHELEPKQTYTFEYQIEIL